MTDFRGGVQLGADRPPVPPYIAERFRPGAEPSADRDGGTPPVRVSLPPHYFAPPFNSTPFYPFESAALGPAATAVRAALQLDSGNVGVVRLLGVALVNSLVTTDLRASLLVNGNPVAPLRRVPGQPAVYIERTWDDYVYITPPGAAIAVRQTIADAGGPYTVTAYLSGWSMPVSEFYRYLTGR